ncbi:RNA helicase [Malassezia yamatoensis]|uniref:RNA helicase n=1 Tax=Malassezia yamatoensis TaxID=253288 RepID=A0AAJ5YPN0_9BASI|nr:RNA helicase [Malassezia yamatoensis]
MGKKKPTLKSNVSRGFATTSVPKRELEEEAPVLTPLDEKATRPSSPSSPGKDSNANAETEESGALQSLVDTIYPRVEKESLRKLKTIEFNQRLAKSLPNCYLSAKIFDQVLALARGEYKQPDSEQVGIVGVQNKNSSDESSSVVASEKVADAGQEQLAAKDSNTSTGLTAKNSFELSSMANDMLGSSAKSDDETKYVEQLMSTWTMLKALGFTSEQADLAIENAPNLNVEESIAFLLFYLSEEDVNKLSLATLEPKDEQQKEELQSTCASAIDGTHPPRHDAYSFKRQKRNWADTKEAQSEPVKAKVTTLNDLSPSMVEKVSQETQKVVADLEQVLKPDSPWTDVIEHAVDAHCTARIALLRIDQEKKRRRKALGAHLDHALADAANESKSQRQFSQLISRANDLMQQAEIQPSFHKKLASQRFKERMKKDQDLFAGSSAREDTSVADESSSDPPEAAHTDPNLQDDRARRRAEIERIMGGEQEPDCSKMTETEASGQNSKLDSQSPPPSEECINGEGAGQSPNDSPQVESNDIKRTMDFGKDSKEQHHSAQLEKDDGSADIPEDSLGALFEESGSSQSDHHVKIRALPASQGGRTPRSLLADLLKRIDTHSTYRFSPLSSGGNTRRSQLDIRWSPFEKRSAQATLWDTFSLTNEGCETQQLADDLIATVALNCLGREQNVHRTLPSAFRAFWDELESARTREKQDLLRGELEHIQALLKRREARSLGTHSSKRKIKLEFQSDPQISRPTRVAKEEITTQYAARRSSSSYQAMLPGREQLPIAASRKQILESVASSQVVVLSGETGCGKSTQLPAYLLEDSLSRGQPCNIYVTEPRRISAITLAERVSRELGEPKGAIGGPDSYIGYAIRLDSQIGRNARLVYATTGIALRMLESNAFEEITHIIIDEVHERSIESDFLLMVLKVLMRQRPDLKVVLMSATLDAERISEYFGGCPTLHVPGRTFPVDQYYLEDVIEMCDYTLAPKSAFALKSDGKGARAKQNREDGMEENDDDEHRFSGIIHGAESYRPSTLETLSKYNEYMINYELIAQLLRKFFNDDQFQGMNQAVLIFLPGIAEIRQCGNTLSGYKEFAPQQCRIHILHSTIAPEEQSEAFDPPPAGMRKIVLATNIAETGITIPDITCVIDTGRHREMRYDEKRKISRLVECFIARSNAKQRRGRAGRVQNGICFHLFTKMRHDEIMDPHPLPEMLRLSLQELALTLKVMRIKVGDSIENALSQALDPPQAINIQRAVASLVEVQALTTNEEITPLGRHLCHMPLDIYLAKFLLIASNFRCLDPALTIAAMLNTKSPFLSNSASNVKDTSRSRFNAHQSDFCCFANMYRSWRQAIGRQYGSEFCAQNSLSQDLLYQVEELRQQYLSYLADTGFVSISKELRRDLTRNRSKHGRPRLLQVPQEINTYGDCVQALTLALVAAFYPKLLSMDPRSGMMRTLTNNQPAAIHPSSVNYKSPAKSQRSHFVLYYSIMMSKRLYASETAYVDDLYVLLVGGEPEFKHSSRSIFLDHNRVRMTLTDAKALVALRLLRSRLLSHLQASFDHPGAAWGKEDQIVFALILEALGASQKMAWTGSNEL